MTTGAGVILLVEDSKDSRDILTIILERASFTIVTAFDGQTALALVDDTRPDIVLLDGTLPDLSGIEVCQRLRASYPALPIVFLSARNDARAINDARAAGANGYILKPIPSSELVDEVRAYLSGKQGSW